MSMSELNTQLEYLAETKEQIKTAITNKGQDITSSVPFREYVDKINNISTLQVDTADANAKVGDIVKDKTAYVNGEKITGTLRESASVFFRAESVTLDDEHNIVKSQGPNNYSGERVVMSSGATGWTEIPYQTLADTIGVTAEKIVQGNTILGIEGTATTGIDTSDATATSGDLAINKTAYVNGEKITGTLPLFPNTSTFTVSNAGVTNNIEDSTLDLTTINTTKQILDSNVSMNFNADYSDVATAIGLTADKLVEGNTILGIEGAASSGSGQVPNFVETTLNYTQPINSIPQEISLSATIEANIGDYVKLKYNIPLGEDYGTESGQCGILIGKVISNVENTLRLNIIQKYNATNLASGLSCGLDHIVTDTGYDGSFIEIHSIEQQNGPAYFETPTYQITISSQMSEVAAAIGLTADKIVEGNTILGIEGTATTGTTADITIPQAEYGLEIATSGEGDNDTGFKFYTNANTQSKLYENGSIVEMHITNELLAQVLGITADKIKKDEVICGITGTYEGAGA